MGYHPFFTLPQKMVRDQNNKLEPTAEFKENIFEQKYFKRFFKYFYS